MYFGDVVIHGVHMFFGDAEITIYRVTGINSETITAQQKQEPTLLIHNHFYYELHLMTADTTCFLVDGKEIYVDTGSLLVIEPEVNHFPFHRGENADEIVFALTVKQRSGDNGFYEYFTSSLHTIFVRNIVERTGHTPPAVSPVRMDVKILPHVKVVTVEIVAWQRTPFL